MCEFSPYGLAMTKDIIWVNLENPSLEAAIEIEDRNQLMLGFTENLPEAIRAFDQERDARLHRRAPPRPLRLPLTLRTADGSRRWATKTIGSSGRGVSSGRGGAGE